MLDKRSFALLEYINGECRGGGYKIFSTAELASSAGEEQPLELEAVRECIKTLAENEYVSVKYQDEEELCAMPLSKGRRAFEQRLDEQAEKIYAARRYAFYSFIGALAGGILAVLIAAFAVLIAGAA